MRYVIAYALTACVFFAIDYVWLTRVAKRFYADQLGDLLRAEFNIAAAAGFYAVYVIGIVFFSVAPALAAQSGWVALVHGALFGFFAYATYDMTNYATLRNWPLAVVVIDIGWGTVLTGTAAWLGYLGTLFVIGR